MRKQLYIERNLNISNQFCNRIGESSSFYKMPLRYNKLISRGKIRRGVRRGAGLINTAINKLPFELHVPGYQFCGPGTRLAKRIARGDSGINKLDRACRQHDLAYAEHKGVAERHEADKILAEKAVERVKSSDASLGERAVALGVATAMKAKVKLGMGCKRRAGGQKRKCGGALTFRNVTQQARNELKKKKPRTVDLSEASKIAFKAVNRIKKKKNINKTPRIIPVPKTGGILPLIPIFAGLSALGALSGGAAGIAKAVKDASAAKHQLEESQRHNKTMEAIAMGKGLYLRPYKRGFGLTIGSKNLK